MVGVVCKGFSLVWCISYYFVIVMGGSPIYAEVDMNFGEVAVLTELQGLFAFAGFSAFMPRCLGYMTLSKIWGDSENNGLVTAQ